MCSLLRSMSSSSKAGAALLYSSLTKQLRHISSRVAPVSPLLHSTAHESSCDKTVEAPVGRISGLDRPQGAIFSASGILTLRNRATVDLPISPIIHRHLSPFAMVSPTEIASNKMFGGVNRRYEHESAVLGCKMKFSVYFPPAAATARVPVSSPLVSSCMLGQAVSFDPSHVTVFALRSVVRSFVRASTLM